MSARYYKYYLVGCLLLWLGSCIEPYRPEVIQVPNNYLVVDGFINSTGPTTIRLSRTVNLDGATIPPGELKARVFIEEEGGAQFDLKEGTNGNYTGNPLQLNATRRYRLRIRTADGKEYASGYEANKITPPIDSVTWEIRNDAVQLYVSTHDPAQNTRYYRWKFDETYEFTSAFYSAYEYTRTGITDRREPIFTCWRGGSSSAILIGSSAKLTQDVISEYPLFTIPSNSVKIDRKYSLLVKQYAQTKEAYEYAETLKKNTESIGTLFDPLPTQLTGNIQCLTVPEEPVIGYINVSSLQEKRIFIKRDQLPPNWRAIHEYSLCKLDTVLLADMAKSFSSQQILPVGEVLSEMGGVIGYTASSNLCVDCRVRGTNVKPGFWE